MKKIANTWRVSLVLVILSLLIVLSPAPGEALDDGEVEGKIEGVDTTFVRDYSTLNYKGEAEWENWGKDLRSLGWIKVQGDSGEWKDLFLLVIDIKTVILKEDGSAGQFPDLKKGDRIRASYRMGWDALHALNVNILTGEQSKPMVEGTKAVVTPKESKSPQ